MDSIQELAPWQSEENLLSYPVLAGPGAVRALEELTSPFSRVVCLADSRVWELHANSSELWQRWPSCLVPSGEACKEWSQLQRVLDFLADSGCDRKSLLVTFGGGSVSDLGGLAASLFKRGIAVAHAPTTLLAQIDASIGGKTAINLPAGKNLVGSFHAPQFVTADSNFLRTLPLDEWRSGLGEVVKTAMLARKPIWQLLQDKKQALRSAITPDADTLRELVAACVVTKAQWVQSDPEEAGSRKALNLGHTFGHAIEHAAGYGKVPHGIAVAMGLGLALEASARTKRLCAPRLTEELRVMLNDLEVPAQWHEHSDAPLTLKGLEQGMAHDKKGGVSDPRFVLPLDLGRAQWDVKLDAALIQSLWVEEFGARA